jgi:tripartite-type tricarboxylate transporter receptor subunit TctC
VLPRYRPSHIAWAQAYPARPVRIIVGQAAGSGSDIAARLLGQRLSERLGQPFGWRIWQPIWCDGR